MSKLILHEIIDNVSFENLPVFWRDFDLKSFSKEKNLYGFQQDALKNALKVLWRYYQENVDYREGEKLEENIKRKQRFYEYYLNHLSFPKGKADYDLSKKEEKKSARLLKAFYPVVDNKISFENFINRMAFWMATGSGKTLVIIKLIEILTKLIQRKEIPQNDILYLTCRDDLIKQFKGFVKEFNDSHRGEFFINLRSLKDYDKVKQETQSLFREKEIVVFYYRSDNLSDVEGKKKDRKILNFYSKENQGKWFILLDEAHKGDKEEAKSQAICSIMSKNGFLFNFSATFVDPRDFLTTAYNFNLEKFIQEGYGKHIYLSEKQIEGFRKNDEFSNLDKERIVLKSLILLTYIKKFSLKVKKIKKSLYHYPLLLVLVNSVNVEDADLKLFFRELEKIGQGKFNKNVFKKAKEEILDEFKKEEKEKFQFEEESFEIDEKLISQIEYPDILREIFNSKNSGSIEVLKIPKNKKELVFKLKKSEKPFALIKIGDISNWLKENLEGYEINESFDNESVFERINRDDSDINILMGSRSFYEGWDSNRPNIVLFINIGVGKNAKKFVLQSIGRGVRIEPEKNKRKRLYNLFVSSPKEIEEKIYQKVKNLVLPLETLFVFGTNIKNLEQVVATFREEKGEGELIGREYFKINPKTEKLNLLVPVYKSSEFILAEERESAKFAISSQDFEITQKFYDYLEDDKVKLMYYGNEIRKVGKEVQVLKAVKNSFLKKENYYSLSNSQPILKPDFFLAQIFHHFSLVPEKLDKFETVKDKIVHFEKIEFKKEKGKNFEKLLEDIKKVGSYEKREKEIKQSKLPLETQKEILQDFREKPFDGIKIKYVPNHYYYPIVLSERGEKISYLNHIIKEKSEVEFIEKLEEYLNKENNLFNQFDWWLFSKLDETTDDVYMPYYDSKNDQMGKFKPDFIFWFCKGNEYFISFVDPKAITFTDYERKVEGYCKLFEENGVPRIFHHQGHKKDYKIRVLLQLICDDKNQVAQTGLERYWFDNIGAMLAKIISLI